MDSSTYYDYERRIEEAYNDKDIDELRRIKDELENYDDPDVKKLVLKLR